MIVNGSVPVTHGMTVGDLRRQLSEDGVPDHATLTLHVDKGYDQMDPGSSSIEVSWDTSQLQPVVHSPDGGFCMDHELVQHRDGKPPWCNACGMDSQGTYQSRWRADRNTTDSRDSAAGQDER